ncbi:MAG: cytochrome c oxidase accessory protein CcoG [Pseudomonadota bacterium]
MAYGQPASSDVNSATAEAPLALYKKREAVHPKLVHGKYRLLKWVLLGLTLSIYYTLPWVRWPRGAHEPNQAVLVDFEGERFYFFFIEIWPDELYFVTGLLVLSALALFLVTALFGRLWCGFACPQTVWTDLFVAVERFVEGDRNKRLKLAKAPWSFDKISKKVVKHSLWLAIAAATGGAWVLYFHDAPSVVVNLFTGKAPLSAYSFIGILTFTTYALAGLMREQVCTYMCPWPRIQAAMTDDQTFNVGYYAARGEPRGKHKKGTSWEARGDCIDCLGCVTACPMGIDIREGDQLECINCGLCADACDAIMKKIGKPIGLIAYGMDYRDPVYPEQRRRLPQWIRPRTVFYTVALCIVGGLLIAGLATNQKIEFTVVPDRAPAYTTLSDGSIRNAANLLLLNKNSETQQFSVAVQGPDALIFGAVGRQVAQDRLVIDVPADKQVLLRVFFTLPDETARQGVPIEVTATNLITGEAVVRDMQFVRGGQ